MVKREWSFRRHVQNLADGDRFRKKGLLGLSSSTKANRSKGRGAKPRTSARWRSPPPGVVAGLPKGCCPSNAFERLGGDYRRPALVCFGTLAAGWRTSRFYANFEGRRHA